MLQFTTQYVTINNLKLTKNKTFSSCTTDVELAIITNEMKKKMNEKKTQVYLLFFSVLF